MEEKNVKLVVMVWIIFNVDMMKKGLVDLNGCIFSVCLVLGWYFFVKCYFKN